MGIEKPRVSKTATTSSGLVWLYENSPERTNLDPSIVGLIPGNSLTAVMLGSAKLNSDEINEEDIEEITDDEAEDDKKDDEGEGKGTKSLGIPSIADIQILSNIVEYDSAGLPTGTVVFRIKNSSGVALKGMNARIEIR